MGVNRRAVFLHSWLWIHHHAIPISDAAGNYTPCNLLIGSSDCHLLQIFEGLNYVIHIFGLTYAVFYPLIGHNNSYLLNIAKPI